MRIKNITEVEPRTVFAIKTSSSTFISDGLAHHNCYACNILYNGQPSAYALQLEKQYGKGIVQELESMRKTITKLKEPYYLENIAKYKALVLIHSQTLGQ